MSLGHLFCWLCLWKRTLEDVVCRYFEDSSAKLYNRGKNQKYWFQRKDENNSKRIVKFMGHGGWWWLRSHGHIHCLAVYIHGNGVSNRANSVTGIGGFRPALWLNLL